MRRMSIKVKELLEERKRRKKFKFEKLSESKPSSSSSSSNNTTSITNGKISSSNSYSNNESWRGKNPCDMSSQEYSEYCQWCANRSGQYDYW